MADLTKIGLMLINGPQRGSESGYVDKIMQAKNIGHFNWIEYILFTLDHSNNF